MGGGCKLGGELGIKVDGFIKAVATLGKSRTMRQRVRQQVEPNLTDLIGHIDAIADDMRIKTGNDVLFIIDGIDKIRVQAARSMFVDTTAMLLLGAKVVYTIPYALIFTPDFGQVRASFSSGHPFILPNIQTHQKDSTPNSTGQDFMRQVLLKRVDESLISAGSLAKLIQFSGGVIKELMVLARESCLRTNDWMVGEGHVLAAAKPVQNIFEVMLSLEDYRELQSVRNDPDRRFTFSPAKERLIQNLSLLLYLDGEANQWCDVHPLVLPLLEARVNELNR